MDLLLSVVFAFFSAVLWASSDLIMTTLLKKSNSPGKAFLYSQLIGAAVLVAIYFLFFNAPLVLSADLVMLLLLAGLMNVISYLAFYKGLQVGKLSLVSPISSCWVVVTVILSVFFLNEPIGLQKGIAISLCVFGILMTSFNLKDLLLSKFMNAYAGANFAMLAALSWGILFVLLSLLTSSLGWFIPVLAIRIISLFMISAYMGAARQSLSIGIPILPMLFLIAIFDAFAFLAYSLAVSSAYTSIIAPIAASFPLFAMIFARIFLKERLSLTQKIGIVLALIGVFLLLS